MSDTKPFFKCPVSVERAPDGSIVFVVTRRDGSVKRFSGPPGVTQLSTNVEAFQKAGEDHVDILFA